MKKILCYIILSLLTIFSAFSQLDDEINQLKNKINSAKHDTDQIHIYRKIGKNYQSQNVDSALKYFGKARKIAEKGEYTSFKPDLISETAKVYFYNGKYEKAIETFKTALSVAQQNNNKQNIYSIKNNIGVIHFNLGNYNKAMEYWKPLLESLKKINDSTGLATLYANFGVIYYSRSNFAKALEYYLKSLDIREKTGNEKGIASINSKIGLIYKKEEEHSKAIRHNKKAYQIYKKMNKKRDMAKMLTNIGNNYKAMDSTQKAIEHYNRSLKLSKEINNKRLIAVSLNNIANQHQTEGNIEKAKRLLKRALQINRELGRKENIATTLSNLGSLYYEIGSYKQAIHYFKKIIPIEKEMGSVNQLNFAYRHLSYCYANLGNYQTAWEYQNKYIKVRDSVFKKEKQEAMEEMKARYETEKKEKEIDLLRKSQKLKETKLQNTKATRNYIIIIASLILVFGVIYFLRFKKSLRLTKQLRAKKNEVEMQKEKIALQSSNLKEINNLLKEKNEEIETQRKHLEDINNTKDRMFSIIAHDLKSPTASLKSSFEFLINHKIKDEEKIHRFHTLMYDSVSSLYNLMNNLLMWAKNQQKEMSFEPKVQNLSNVIKNNIAVMQTTAANKKIDIQNHTEDNVMAAFDENMTSTVIRNFLSNAIKFTPSKGKVFIQTKESENYAEVSISDTGIGISQEVMDKIMNAESHYTTTGTNKEKGSGLGISISKRFIERHGMELKVSSIKNKGTTFSFKLPKEKNF